MTTSPQLQLESPELGSQSPIGRTRSELSWGSRSPSPSRSASPQPTPFGSVDTGGTVRPSTSFQYKMSSDVNQILITMNNMNKQLQQMNQQMMQFNTRLGAVETAASSSTSISSSGARGARARVREDDPLHYWKREWEWANDEESQVIKNEFGYK